MAKHPYPSDLKSPHEARKTAAAFWLGLAAVTLAVLVWAFWPVIFQLVKEWEADEDYSVGLLVPFVAVYLAWREREALRKCDLRPCWWGVGLILLAQAARFYGLLFLFESAERYALVLTIAGLVLLIVGWQAFRRLGWVLLFLFLMVPLPGRVHNMVSGPLQNLATAGAVFLLEVFGVSVIRTGNVMTVNGTEVAVAEACSGLRMLTAFIVVSATLAYLVKRPRWQKAVLVASSVPIAILCNLARLCVTAELYAMNYSEAAEAFFHDFAGLAMMPPAVFMLAGLLWLMNRLVVPDAEASSVHPKAKAAEKSHPKAAAKAAPTRS